MEDSKQQFEEDTSCRQVVAENLDELFTVVLSFRCLILMFTSNDEFIQEYRQTAYDQKARRMKKQTCSSSVSMQ